MGSAGVSSLSETVFCGCAAWGGLFLLSTGVQEIDIDKRAKAAIIKPKRQSEVMRLAERRMFARKIMNGGPFLRLPTPVQALYVQLCLWADDDGFLDNVDVILRLCDWKQQDIQLLIDKGFLLSFDSEVMCITHWRTHNLIRKDRYHPSIFLEKEQVDLDEVRGNYIKKCDGQPNGNQRLPQSSLGKASLEQASLEQASLDQFSLDKYRQEKPNPDQTSCAQARQDQTKRPACEQPVTKPAKKYDSRNGVMNYAESEWSL